MGIEQILLISARQINEYEANFKKVWLSPGVLEEESEEIKAKFKYVYTSRMETYTYFKLKSGRFSMIKTLCREDDYIVNGFIFDSLKVYPYEIINSPDFKDVIEDKEKLPALDILRKGPNRQSAEIMKYVASKGEKTLEQIVNSIIALESSGDSLNIIDRQENFMYWITAISSVFPVSAASKITFTTCDYLTNEKGFAICYKGFKEQATQGYYFDFLGGIKAFVQREYRYAQIANTGFFKSRNIISGLHRFLSQFSYEGFGEELDYGCTLFIMFNFPAIKPSKDDIARGIMFLSKYCSDELRESMFERHGGALEETVKELNSISSLLLIDFIIATFNKIKSYAVYERCLKVFYETIDAMAFNLEIPLNKLYKFYGDGENENKDKPSFYKYHISGSRIELINNLSLVKNAAPVYEFYLFTTINSFIKLGYTWEQAVNTKGFQIFLDASVRALLNNRGSIDFVLDSIEDNREFFIRLVMIVYNRMEADSYTRLLAEKITCSLSEFEETEANKLRRELYKLGGGNILLEEFTVNLQRAENKKEYFSKYLESVFSPMPEYYNKYYDQALLCYLNSLEEKEAFEEATNFLKDVNDKRADIDRNSLQGIISVFEKNLQLKELKEYRDIIKNVAKLKRAWDIKTYPDIIYLSEMLFYIEEDEEINVIELIEDVKLNIRGVSRAFITEYLGIFFDGILSHVRSKEEHREIIDFIFEDDADNKILYYFESIAALFKNNRMKGYGPLVHFVAYYFFYVEPFHRGKNDGIVEYMDKRLNGIFEAEARGFLEKVNGDMREEFEEKGFSIPLKWIEMYKREAENKTVRGKIKNLFNKK